MNDDVLQHVAIAQPQVQARAEPEPPRPFAVSARELMPRLVQKAAPNPMGSGDASQGNGVVFGQEVHQGLEASNMVSADNVLAFAPGVNIDASAA